jgi:hypothetical protein
MATAANAAPKTWYFTNVTFSDGGKASGSFIFDADQPSILFSAYTSINITTTSGSIRSGSTYGFVVPSFNGNSTQL